MGIGETDGLLGNEETRGLWSEPYQIEVPRLADGKLGFSISVEKFNNGNLSDLSNVKVSIVKENCLSKELRKSLYITKVDGADIHHLQKLTDVKDVLRKSTGTVVLLEARERLSLCSDDEDQVMTMNCNDDSFAGSSNCSSGSSYSTGSMNSLLQQSSSHCRRFFPHGQSLRLLSLPLPQLSQPRSNGSLSSIMETLSLQEAVFRYPDRIKWDCKTKKIKLHKSQDGTFNFEYYIMQSSTNSLESSMDSSMFCLVTLVQGVTVGKLKRGDLILSLNKIPCQHYSVKEKIDRILRTSSEITLIIQRPEKFVPELLRGLELLQKVIYPTRRVFMVGSGAGTYFNSFGVKYDFLGLAYNHNHQHLPPIKTSAFKACCVQRIGNRRTFSVSPWTTRWQSAGCSLLGDQVQQDVIELVGVFDESFFHNCMNISFTKDSIFLVMTECDKLNDNEEVSRILHTVHTCVGKDANVRLFVVCQHGASQCAHAMNHQSLQNKSRQTKLLEVPRSPNDSAVDIYFSSIFDIVHITKPLQVNQATLRYLSERTETNIIPNLYLSVKEMFKMFTEKDTLDVVADLKQMREFIGVDLKERPIRSTLHPSRHTHNSLYFAANIEFLLTSMSQMAYASTLIHRGLLLKHLQPHESNALEILSVLESNKVIFGLKSCGHRLTNNYYVPFLQQNVSLKLNELPETPYVLYIDFTTNVMWTDFLELVVQFGNSQGWDFSQELELCVCHMLFEKFHFTFEFRPLIKQIRIIPRYKFTREQHWAALIRFWNQLTSVCKHVFPLNILKEHARCDRPSCIYCGSERNSGPSIIRCRYLEKPKKKQAPPLDKTLVLYANYDIIKCISDGLNERPEHGWKKIAAHLNLSNTHVNSCENCKDPSECLLWEWSASDANCTISDLRNILLEINRMDLVRKLDNYTGGSVGNGNNSLNSSNCSSIRSHTGGCSSSASCSGTASSVDGSGNVSR